jgi:SAM-dependent methyltransferase
MSNEATRDFRRISYEATEALAPGWERRRPFIEGIATPVREWLLGELAPQPGQTLLELAAGAGDTGFEAAALIGPTGRLISTDFSPGMQAVARRRGAELAVGNVDYRLMDAERLELEDDTVDGVICRFGYMLMIDPDGALAETRRVLRPGGHVVLAVWAAAEQNPFFSVLGRTMVERGHIPPPDPAAPGQFSLANADKLRALLDHAGFTTMRIEELPVRFPFPDIDDFLAMATDTGGPIAPVLRGLPDDERQAIKTQLADAFAPFTEGARYEVPGVTIAAVAS